MTQSFSTNSANDIFLGPDGNISISTGIFAVEFACKSAAQAQLQEMIFAYNQGVAYFPTIWTNEANVAQFEASIRMAIASAPGVTSIQDFEISIEDNIASYSATILTQFGQGAISGTFIS